MSGALLWVGVALLGGAGAVLRLLVDRAVQTHIVGFGPRSARRRTAFPLGIFVVNVTGSFAAGLLVGAALDADAGLLALTAFVGSYTTFSTWMLDTVDAALASQTVDGDGAGEAEGDGQAEGAGQASRAGMGVAIANVAISVVAGFVVAAAGHALGSAL